MKDANGTEIKIGSIVKHKHEPLPAGESATKETAHQMHSFHGVAMVVDFTCIGVIVERTNRGMIPHYLAENVVVVK